MRWENTRCCVCGRTVGLFQERVMKKLATGILLLLLTPVLSSANVTVKVAQNAESEPPKAEKIEVATEDKTKSGSPRAAEALRAAAKTNEKAGQHSVELICRTQKLTGSRIKRNRCLTLAQWAHEAEKRVMQAAEIPMNRAPTAWATTP